MSLRKIIARAALLVRKRYYLAKYPTASPGTVAWLVGTEIKYGGLEANIPRNKVSPHDPRSEQRLHAGGMVGGDRMLYHNYAKKYAQYLLPYVDAGRPVTVVEIGILKGTGLAIWCDLFPDARVLGLDIDLGHIHGNMDNLRARGAFEATTPELHEFDQLVNNGEALGAMLGGDRVDICIDDGCHTAASITTTMGSVMPYLADRFVYFIEDNRHVHEAISSAYPALRVDSAGTLTIVSRG